jgi:hypothetical protein
MNEQDIRYDLVPVHGLSAVNKVFSSKLMKYSKNKWKDGLAWTDVLSNLKKHLLEFEQGHDFTADGLLNMAHVAEDALILCEYYKIYPQGDDRNLSKIKNCIIGCDLDDVIFDFHKAYEERFHTKLSDYWNGDYNMSENLKTLQKDKDFWINLPLKQKEVPFEIDYYITARSIPNEWTEESIQRNNLPKAPIISVNWDESKLEVLKKLGVSIMIDDKYSTFKECKENGIFCYLVDGPANKHYEVGHHRIYNLSDLKYLK